MSISFQMINHYRLMDQAINNNKLTARLEFSDHTLTVYDDKIAFTLFPQFQNQEGFYEKTVSESSKQFTGWRPYKIKTWETATNKLAFKQLLVENTIRTPSFANQTNDALTDVIIKPNKSSFSSGIKGPFKTTTGLDFRLKQYEFYEAFIEGKIVKVWYWNHQPYVAEMLPPLSVVGNGSSTISELIADHARIVNRSVDISQFEEFLAFKGLTLNTVLDKNERCTIDFKSLLSHKL